jgi:hypothetical protein
VTTTRPEPDDTTSPEVREVLIERAWLAVTDPAGEWDAVERWDWHDALDYLTDALELDE